jgi:hypothetical protein
MNPEELTIGFSTGCFFKAGFDNPNQFIERILKAGGKAVELQYFTIGSDRTGYLDRIDLDLLSELEHVTLHLTSRHEYRDDEDTRYVMDRQVEAYEKFGATEAIIHPDRVFHIPILYEYKDKMNILVENMDELKDNYRTPEELKPLDDFGRILDLQHVYANDRDMKEIKEYISPKGLGEVHISALNGYPELHYPLYKKKQDIIIDRFKELNIDKSIPIIIESLFEKPGEEQIELEYILERISK